MIYRDGILKDLAAIIAFWLVLVVAYQVFVTPVFRSEFVLDFIPTNALVALFHVVYVSAIVLYLDVEPYRPSRVGVMIIFVFLFIPFCAFYAFREVPYWNLGVLAVGMFHLAVMVRALPVVRIPPIGQVLSGGLMVGAAAITLYVFAGLLLQGGLQRFSLDFGEVYEMRRQYMAQVSFPLSAYFITWVANVLNISFIAVAIVRSNRKMLILGIVAQVLIFALTSFKSFALAPFIVVAIMYASERMGMYRIVFMVMGATILSMLVYFQMSGNVLLPSILVRRQFVIPALLHSYYFEYFSLNPKVLLSNSILSLIFDYPYSQPVTRVISFAYFGRDFGPNVGVYGDAFTHFGVVGIFVFNAILAGLLKIADSVGSGLRTRLVAGIMALPLMSLVNSALFTTMLTHGLLLSILVAWFVGSRDVNRLRASGGYSMAIK